MKELPSHCPSCKEKLSVKRLYCSACETEVEGLYPLPPLARLSKDDQAFVSDFIKSSGSLKEMANIMRVSYPTVRNRLDDIIANLKQNEKEAQEE